MVSVIVMMLHFHLVIVFEIRFDIIFLNFVFPPQAKDKEERLLKRQQNRERMEEKRRLRAAQNEEQGTCAPVCVCLCVCWSGLWRDFLVTDRKKLADQRPRAKEARKEKKVLEKKVALSRQRKRDSRLVGQILVKPVTSFLKLAVFRKLHMMHKQNRW